MNIQAEIKLWFQYFDVRYDYLEVRDGGYEASPLVGM